MIRRFFGRNADEKQPIVSFDVSTRKDVTRVGQPGQARSSIAGGKRQVRAIGVTSLA
ncbi:hypothetical protein PTQ53_21515 [Klebsiella michiganensis]|uniref:hypothetical protein n=1 Tax=Klebsiella michiganensis TaxID=1134687 RepID=UPI00190A6BC6|nr:hypothetical protein [Klebsiella michiganensis]ELC0837309.1 hypothetical protein [Klebsiella michiganensis]ELF4771972.1 hypothetical protein [Klebsiella michiganensis]ELP0294624.1 hypothetical protein [Klebsiella michiganensis]MBK4131304.1 hypothetical protein [Klebsiella michiganensis]MDS7761683.1 hypothetical protein [Klebsiella michiganensis]